MSNEEKNLTYKEILSAYRNGDEERYSGMFEEAFNALESDAELAAWFEQDMQLDDEFRAALNEYEVPEQKTVATQPKAKIIKMPLLKLAAAALFAFILAGALLMQNNRKQDQLAANLVQDLRQSMAAFAASKFELDAMNNDLSVLREIITSNGGTFGDAMDEVFAKGLPMGCKVVDWNGRSVSLYCFGNDAGQVVHSFVVPLNELNGELAAKHLKEIVVFSERDTGGFISGDAAYLLVSSMPGVDIKQFLLPAQEIYAIEQTGSSCVTIALLPLYD